MNLEDVDTRCVSDDGLPWMPFTPLTDLVHVKLLFADPVSGELIVVLRAGPGIELPRHRTSCSTTIYTLQGRWKYREHDWVAGPGSLVIEPASSYHTPQVLADGTDDAILFIMAGGDLQFLDSQDRVIATENWRTAVERYLDYCRSNDLEPRNLLSQALA